MMFLKEDFMVENKDVNKKQKSFFARMIEKIDKAIEEKAQSKKCCCCADKDKKC